MREKNPFLLTPKDESRYTHREISLRYKSNITFIHPLHLCSNRNNNQEKKNTSTLDLEFMGFLFWFPGAKKRKNIFQ